MPSKRTSATGSASPLPTKWAVGFVVVLIGYALLQPQVNQRLGWQLPSLSSLQQGEPTPSQREPAQPSEATKSSSPSAQEDQSPPTASSKTASSKTASSKTQPSTPESSNAAADDSLRYGLLKETAPDDFMSLGGLRYTRGSEQGHRLKHIERHLEDDPDRPGKHGVFNGDMPQVLRWLDEAYTLGKRGAQGTKKIEEDGRTVYEVSFLKPIGFIGGRDGRRAKHPDARRIRLVVDGNKVITAFPF